MYYTIVCYSMLSRKQRALGLKMRNFTISMRIQPTVDRLV